MELSSASITRIRGLAAKVRKIKESDYDGITWDDAMRQVARDGSSSTDEYYLTLALFGYFLDESRAMTSLNHFLEGVEDTVADLRHRDKDYAISESERQRIRTLVDAYLNRARPPTSQESAFDYYQVLIDRIFTSVTLDDLLATTERLSVQLQKWFPQAFMETHHIAGASRDLAELVRLASGPDPITLATASYSAGRDLTHLKSVLHRFVCIGVLSVTKMKRQNAYSNATPEIDVNRLRKEWSWLWASPYKRISHQVFER